MCGCCPDGAQVGEDTWLPLLVVGTFGDGLEVVSWVCSVGFSVSACWTRHPGSRRRHWGMFPKPSRASRFCPSLWHACKKSQCESTIFIFKFSVVKETCCSE